MNNIDLQKRIEWIDIARGIGILLVIIGHIGMGISEWIYSYHIPLFFFLSGICFKPKKNYKEFLGHKVKTIIIPYIFLGLIGIFFQLIFYSYDANWLIEALLQLLIQEKYMTIWFLACLFVVENLFYLIVRINKKLLTIIISVVLFIIAAIYYRLGGTSLPWCIDTAFAAMPFFCVGFYSKELIDNWTKKEKGKEEIKKILIFVVLGVIQISLFLLNNKIFGNTFAMYNNSYIQEWLTIPAAFIGIYCVIFVSQRIHFKSLQYIGKNSLVYFAWHQVIMFPIAEIITYDWISNLISNSLILTLFFFIIVVILCTIANIIVVKTPLRFCIGKWEKEKTL